MNLFRDIQGALKVASIPENIPLLQRFFKSGPGDYAEGDILWGIKVPQQRTIAKKFQSLVDLETIDQLLTSPVHESRQTALILLIGKFQKSTTEEKSKCIKLYESRFDFVNNWDLVDCSAPYLTGPWYWERDRPPLYEWAASTHLWTQRIAVLTTFYFIRQRDFSTTLELADQLLQHPHDLMQKAVGWMIREVGNRNLEVEENFLKTTVGGVPRYKLMPRTMLRYAIEKFPREKYLAYLRSEI